MIETYIRNRLKQKEILLMTHIVMGYPSFDASLKIVEEMVKAGVDLDVTEFHLCMVCGYIELGSAPEKCPVCGAKKKIFELIA